MSIDGNDNANTLTGTLGDDVINGFGEADNILATQGADVVDGGTGNDRLTIVMGDATRFASFSGARTYTITSASATDSSGLLNTALTSIERITLDLRGTGDFNDTVDLSGFTTAATIPVTVYTGNGDNQVTGSNYNDTITLGTGSNVVDAGGGSDGVVVAFDNDSGATLFVSGAGGAIQTSLSGGSANSIANAEFIDLMPLNYNGSSTIDASAVTGFTGQIGFRDTNGSDVFVGHDGADFFANTYLFTGGGDTYTGNGGADIYDYTFAVNAMDGDVITDLDGDDIIDFMYNNATNNGGGFLADQFIGNAGFTGVAGQYRYFSTGGQTFVEADTNGDGVADETLTIANGQFALGETTPGSNQLHIIGISGTSGDDNLGGTAGDDTIYGQGGNDSINPYEGINYVDGGDGNDMTVLQVEDFGGATIFVSGADGTIITTQNGVDTNTVVNTEYVAIWTTDFNSPQTVIDASGVTGFNGILSFWDTNGSDITIGSHGADNFGSVDGATLGHDVFTGNGGADVYDYSYSITALNGDMINDFDADDTIDLRSVNNSSGLIADQFIGTADFTGVAGQYRYFAYDNQTFVQVDTDGDAIADQMLTIGNGQFVLAETAPGSNILQMVGSSGTGDDDFLVGTMGDDQIYAQGGNDTIAATGGMDHDYGGDGGDQLRFVMANMGRFTAAADSRTFTITDQWVGASDGAVNTYYYDMESLYLSTVGTGDFGDAIDGSGATVNLIVRAGGGDDTIVGGSGDDNITTGLGTNSVDAGGGNDLVVAQFDNDLGATAYVTLVDGAIITTVDGQTNTMVNAEAVGVQGFDFNAGSVIDASGLTGFGGTFVFYDTNGTNIDIGSTGNDIFANVNGGEAGNDSYTGNGGADVYDYTFAVGAMNGDMINDFDADDIIDLQYNNATQNGGGLLADQFIGTADFTGVAGQYRYFAYDNQTFVQVDTDGDAIADEMLTIGNGQFTLAETAPGSNILRLIGSSGTGVDDFLIGSKDSDDVIYAQGGDDTIATTGGSDFVDGGEGWDQLRFQTGYADRFTPATGSRTYTITDSHVGDSSGSVDTSFANVESIFLRTLENGDFGDTIDASALTSAGLILRLGAGSDTVIGGAGDDDLGLNLGVNIADAGAGYDIVYTAFDNTAGSTAYVTSADGAVILTVDGAQMASIVNAESVQITGYYASGVTTTIDASGYYAIPGVQLVLRDSNGSDTIIGSNGADMLSNVSNNTLGADSFTGNGGADIFDYTYASNGINGDTITDLDGDDVIDFRFNDGTVEGASPLLCNQFIGGANFSGTAGQYRYATVGGQTQIQVDSDGDGVADQVMTIANGAFALGETAPGSNILHIIGGAGSNAVDTLTGTLGDDSIYALGSNDIINGSQGTDFVNGGNGGGDRLFMNTGDANLFTLATGARTYTIGATTITDSSGTLNTSFTQVERIAFSTVGNGDFDDVIDASAFVSAHGSALDIRLGNGDNLVTGSSSNDRLFTGFGSNIADGGDGYDFAQVNADASSAVTVTITNVGGVLTTNTNGTINQLTGFEEVWVNGVGSGAVTLDASGYVSTPDMALYLIGHNGTDIMIGSAANDFFANTTGQVLGNDVYTGNGGADIYDYTFAADSMNGDTITDFDIDDVIDFRFNNLEQGGSPVVATHFIGDAAFTGTAGEYRYQINGTQTIVQVDSNGDTVVDQTLTISNGGFMLAETAPGSNILTLAAVINPLDGVVADGYVAGATLFVDVNGNGVRDGGEAWTTTDASGNFTLNVNQAGTIVAIGGVNADTGLANTMTLMAPSDSGVVNPLTTLVEAVIQASGGATTADQAAAQVLAAFGLDPSLDLLNLDLLGQGSDPAALEAQKAAAMVANLVSAAEGASGAGADTESALVSALADLVADAAPGTTVDLTDAATLTPLLTEALPGVTNVTTIANEVAAESETIAAATSIEGISDAQLDAALIDYSLNNTITGDAGDNHLFGFGGNDKLSGLGGNDILEGGSGFDFLWGGAGNDKFVAENSASKEQTKVGAVSMDVIFDFVAGDKIDLRQIDANAALAGQQVFNFKGTNAIKVAGDLNYKVYDTVMGAEKALGHDIDGISGASTYSGPVTIVYGNVDSGGADFAIALIGVNGVKASDFIFA